MSSEQQQLTIINHTKKEKIILITKDLQEVLFDPSLTSDWDIFVHHIEWGEAGNYHHLDYITKNDNGLVLYTPINHKHWMELKYTGLDMYTN